MKALLPPHPLQTDLELEFADILILEYAALSRQCFDLRSFLSGVLTYTKAWLPALKLAEAQQRVQQLQQDGLLDLRWRCPEALVMDLAAQAVLYGRAESRAIKRSPRPTEDPLLALEASWMPPAVQERIVNQLIYPSSLAALGPELQELAFAKVLPSRLDRLEPGGAILAFMETMFENMTPFGRSLLQICRLASGGAQALRSEHTELPVALQVLQGQDQAAINYLQGMDLTGASTVTQLFYILAVIRQGKELDWFRLRAAPAGLRVWGTWLEKVRRGHNLTRPDHWNGLKLRVGLLLVGGAALWDEDFDLFQQVQPDLREARDKAAASGWGYLAQLFDELAEDRPGPLRDFLPRSPGWRRQLDRLINLGSEVEPAAERLVWRMVEEDGQWRADPYLQKRNKKGWTPGRNLMFQSAPYGLSRQNQRALSAFRERDLEDGWRALVGHPLLFWEDHPVQLSLGEPQLRVHRQDGRIGLRLHPSGLVRGHALHQISADRFELVLLPLTLADLAEALGTSGFSVPEECEEQLAPLLSKVSGLMSIASDVEVTSQSIEERELHRTVYLRMTPSGAGLRLQALVRPFGPGTNAYLANDGPARLVIQQHGRTVQVVRDLQHEQRVLAELGLEGGGPWALPEPLSCLEFLDRLAGHDPLEVEAEWPEGQTFRLKRPSGSWRMQVESQTDWFEVTGGLELEPGHELKVLQMLEMLGQAQGTLRAPLQWRIRGLE